MRTHRVLLAVATTLLAATAGGPAGAANLCEQAGAEAEREFSLPSGLLQAIGRVESGRYDPARGKVAAWPWTIDISGVGQQFANMAGAVRATEALRTSGARNIDVGCFQVSLLYHPGAFKDLNEAFDPTANGRYAGQFLSNLKARLGSWTEAVAAYHSADPARGIPYQQMVFATWRVSPPVEVAQAPEPAAFGIRIWTPSPPGQAPSLIHIGPPGSDPVPQLPRMTSAGG